ncbi:major facilitator superfamily domain-containing protein 6 [Fopius arisanus]|uniref:Major facilitator superfamily domain-containing protein 6 n=2 Tax=Fopius arisanus TaxID=64838 RepID=A0A9R1TNF2_9HYME|nr:PREDICTED: major facilitator superfamily domain-containing protein 6 [Fopius arisanus]XP_011312346.1 PREDICTED: major facilitator superfamily domain-containing protein 6 [Fopius arisanus]
MTFDSWTFPLNMSKVKINGHQLPIKAHYFFFMAAMGPILPFLPVYGKQLGVSSVAMGTITAILPFLFLLSKPVFGFLVDYFRNWRKTIFIGILIGCSLSFVLLYCLPRIPELPKDAESNENFTRALVCGDLKPCTNQNNDTCSKNHKSQIVCSHVCNTTIQRFYVTIKLTDLDGMHLTPHCIVEGESDTKEIDPSICLSTPGCSINCPIRHDDMEIDSSCLLRSSSFWIFVLLFSLGSIGFNVTNSISDAICFDVLGAGGHMGYGRQRVWGTIGFGIAALIAGGAIDLVSKGHVVKSYTPAFLLVIIFTIIDAICCKKLELPIITGSKNIVKDVLKLLRTKVIAIFLVFATIAGILDSFVIYFLFWYLEDLAIQTNHMEQIKLIEGLIVAAETLGGEVVFFSLSGKILKKFGYGISMTFCFVCYGLRLGLISLVPNPWWVIPIELLMQGPTYALCYTIIVGFASVVAPPGTSATVQGIIAGMDDGLGFALGSLLGGIMYKKMGGPATLQSFSALAGITAVAYFIIYTTILREEMPKTKRQDENGETNSRQNVEWKSPEAAAEECQTLDS